MQSRLVHAAAQAAPPARHLGTALRYAYEGGRATSSPRPLVLLMLHPVQLMLDLTLPKLEPALAWDRTCTTTHRAAAPTTSQGVGAAAAAVAAAAAAVAADLQVRAIYTLVQRRGREVVVVVVVVVRTGTAHTGALLEGMVLCRNGRQQTTAMAGRCVCVLGLVRAGISCRCLIMGLF